MDVAIAEVTLVNATELLKCTIKKLQEEMAGMSSQLLRENEARLASCCADIRVHLNEECPVNRCPLEILGSIFVLSLTSSPGRIGLEEPKSYWPPVTDKVAASIGFMQVCRYWRDVVVVTPGLWNTLRDRSGRFQAVFLQRCGDMPLDVLVAGHPSRALISLLQSRRHRVRSLQLEHFKVKYSHLLDDLELELETLALVIPRGGWDDKPPLEFRLRSPGLHRLYFVNVSPLPQDKFSNVTYIGLFDCHRVLLSDLVRLLGECPILEDLIIASHIHGSTNPTRAVPLLRLRRLAVAWLEDHTLATFLSHVEMALTTAVQIQLHGALRDSPLFHALKGIPVMQSVSRLLLGTSLDRYSFMAVGPTAGLRFNARMDSIGSLLNKIVPCLPLGHIQQLWLRSTIGQDLSELSSLLQRMSSLRSIFVWQGFDLREVITALTRRDEVDSATPPGLGVVQLNKIHVFTLRGDAAKHILATIDEAQRTVGLQVDNVVIAYARTFLGEEVPATSTTYDKLFPSVQYVIHDIRPPMEVPAVCMEGHWLFARLPTR